MLDVLIRGARVCDGSGGKSFTADVGVRDGAIAVVGTGDEPARRSIDASGLALMPGIVDIHTHYDAQITWDATLSPSVALGVTTAVMGNCGFGIAPCPAPLRETLLRNLSVVEGMDVDALIYSLIVVVVGGLGTLSGAIAGAGLVGPADTFGKVLFPQFALALIFAIMAFVLLLRPTGLLGRVRITR